MQPNPLPLAALVILGFLVGIAGHLYRSNAAIIAGIALVVLGSIGLPILLYVSDR